MSRSKILLIYTGGTIGMEISSNDGSLVPLPFEKMLAYVPELSKINCDVEHYAFKNPVDSSDADPVFWNDIGAVIEANYSTYDGFVVLHGTDTMAYTASALSFMLKNLNKPVVLTGSQLPMGTFRTDGRENLISAIEVATLKRNGENILKEVAIYFEYSLYRGNRCHKLSTEHFDAIISPNYQPLAEAGVHINWNFSALKSAKNNSSNLEVIYNWDSNISIIKMFPGITPEQLEYAFNQEGIRVFILETFGSGNISMKNKMLSTIENAISAGKLIINVSQCRKGAVDQKTYASGVRLAKMGVISAEDMTLESAVIKSMHVLGNPGVYVDFKGAYESNLAGELTLNT